MTDIVERLRETITARDVWYQGRLQTSDTLLERFSRERKEAADEIERLREALEEMLEACQANYMLGIERGKEDVRQLRAENERTKAYNEQLNAQANDKGWRLMHRSKWIGRNG